MSKYYYHNGTDKQGPFTMEELRNENISQDTYVWYEGLNDQQRSVVDNAVKKANEANRAWLKQVEPGMIGALEKAGVNVQRLSATARREFVEKSRNIYFDGVLTPAQAAIWLDAAGHKSN